MRSPAPANIHTRGGLADRLAGAFEHHQQRRALPVCGKSQGRHRQHLHQVAARVMDSKARLRSAARPDAGAAHRPTSSPPPAMRPTAKPLAPSQAEERTCWRCARLVGEVGEQADHANSSTKFRRNARSGRRARRWGPGFMAENGVQRLYSMGMSQTEHAISSYY